MPWHDSGLTPIVSLRQRGFGRGGRRVGFRGKQIATITLVAAAVALATSLMNAAAMTRLAVREARGRAELLAQTLYHQAREPIREKQGPELHSALASAPSLRSYAQAVVGYSEIILYLAIVDESGQVIFHSDPRQEGKPLRPARSIAEFSERPALVQLWQLMRERQVLAADLPFSLGSDRPAGTVRVALSTLLLRKGILGAVSVSASLAGAVVLLVFLSSFYLANRLLAPIEMLQRELRRIDIGDQPPLDLRSTEDVSRVAEFFSSISRRFAQDRQLRQAESTWLETMLSGLADAVLVVNEERRIVSLNSSARKFFDPDAEAPQARLMGTVVPEGHALRSVIDEALACGGSIEPRTIQLRMVGREVPHTVLAQVLREAGRATGVVVTARDMEKLSRLGSHLSYTQKLAALGQLTAGVAHEIRNPLNALVLHASLLREKCPDLEVQHHLEVLDREIRRLDRVIDGFLKFTRPETPQFDAVDLEQVLDQAMHLVSSRAERNGVRIEREIRPGLQPIYGDRQLLQQAFYNLMLNACEATPGEGLMRVEACRQADGRTVVRIEDTGLGIAAEVLPKIFDLYYTTKSEGSGIGLSLTYRIVQLHGGEIAVDSVPGEGTRFTVSLPEVRV